MPKKIHKYYTLWFVIAPLRYLINGNLMFEDVFNATIKLR